ncbi:hypothetical protein P0136_04410 [Lentisphaerota bacterium ZTH]|nr:hypothetical protein JYG24_04470 [Lentisphaerota bacterium]WET07237.1 hypothetical protein P0136_04410 [Lentisphaerota bacterium ZTH]
MPNSNPRILEWCQNRWRAHLTRENHFLLKYVTSLDRFAFSPKMCDEILGKFESQEQLCGKIGFVIYLVEIMMGMTMGKVCYTKHMNPRGSILMDGWDARVCGNPLQEYSINDDMVIRYDLLRKALLALLGMATMEQKNNSSYKLLHDMAVQTVQSAQHHPDYKDFAATMKTNLLTILKFTMNVPEGESEKFLLWASEIACGSKHVPDQIQRVYRDGSNYFRTVIEPLVPNEHLAESIAADNAFYLEQKSHDSWYKNLFKSNLHSRNNVLSSQSRKFMPHALRNTYTVRIQTGSEDRFWNPFVITACPTPFIKGFKGNDQKEATRTYYRHLRQALQSKYGRNVKPHLISLVTELQGFNSKPEKWFYKKLLSSKPESGKYGAYAASKEGFTRSNYKVTYTKGRGMKAASTEAIKKAFDRNTIVIMHCESGVDRAGTLLEHIIYRTFDQYGKGAEAVAAMANGAFNAMIFNLQFGVKPKGIGYSGLKDAMDARLKGKISGKNKKFMGA